MADDDDDPSSGEPEPEAAPRHVVRLRPPTWFIVVLALGWMLAVRLEMTTNYVARGRLEAWSLIVAGIIGTLAGLRFVTKRPDDDAPQAPWRIRRWRFVVVFVLTVPVSIPAANGFLAVVNRVGVTTETVRVSCTTTKLESRARMSGGRSAMIRYWCTMPDGQSIGGRAPEELPAEPGKPLIIPSVRGRLGVWIRVGPPEPVEGGKP